MVKMKCISCNAKTGKRICPALNGSICTVCCGMKRLKEINCPDDCQYLENIAFQEVKDFNTLKRKWFSEHYKMALDDLALLEAINEIEKFIIVYDVQIEQLDRYVTLKGIQFLRRAVSPIEHIEVMHSDFEDYLKSVIKPFSENQDKVKNLIPAIDYLIERFDKNINSEEKFEEYKSFLKGFFRVSGIDLREDIEILCEELKAPESKEIIIP